MATDHKRTSSRFLSVFMELFGLSRGVAIAALLFSSLLIVFAIFWFFHSAPPRTLIITGGPAGSSFEANAEKYRAMLARDGVTLKILPSQGSLENLQRLEDPSFHVDIGFVQGGSTTNVKATRLVSLGGITHQPMEIFYRSPSPLVLLSEFKGKRLAIGPEGSGTHSLALALLALNGIAPGGDTMLLNQDAGEAAKALLAGQADAVFLMGDSASTQLLQQLLQTPDVKIMDFAQADAYTRRISYLSQLTLPQGYIDFAKNIPPQDVHLVGPTVELLVRPSLHPALSDLLLETAHKVHGDPGMLKHKGEFPSAQEHEFPLSADAQRFYKSGKTFLYRSLPFWLASLVSRILVVFVPLVVVLVPGLKAIPAMFRWRMKMNIYRWYRALLSVERELRGPLSPGQHQELVARLDEIETAVNKMKVPASFADAFYGLRGHIGFVRERLTSGPPAA